MPTLPRLFGGGLAVLLPFGVWACGGAPAAPPHLILISVDTLRPDHLGCYGYPRDTSPTIDALAAEGTLFLDCTSSAPWTLPGHATMLTGLYPSHHGVRTQHDQLPGERMTLAERLRARGYRTHAVVNAHNVAGPFGLDQGFETFHYVPESVRGPDGMPRILNRGREVLEEAERILDESDGQPLFLFLHFYDVHTDFTPDPAYRERLVDPYSGGLTGNTMQLLAIRQSGQKLSEADLRFLRQMYDAEIRQLDDLLAKLVDSLDRRGYLENALVVLTSDHGEEFFEHGGLLHGRTQYQELLAIPWILRGPGVPHGLRIPNPVGLVDLVPTVLSLLGIPARGAFDGVDLGPLLRGEELPLRPYYGEADHNNIVDGRKMDDIKAMIRVGPEKLCLDRRTGDIELYDLASDPRESVDKKTERPERAQALLAALRSFLASRVSGEATREMTQDERRLMQALGYAGED